MLVVGLTGGIGSGKSVVSNIFHQDFNIPIIDADIIVRGLSQTSHVIDAIYKNLGADFFDKNRVLQRGKLRRAVFSDSKTRYKLEKILHPLVYKEISLKIKSLDADYCIIVVPLLLETKHTDLINRILVVDCTVEEQIQRVMLRDQCNEAHVKAIISTQIDRSERIKLADDVIENHGNIESLKEKIAILHEKYNAISKTTSKS